MRSYRIAQSVADRARGVLRIERLDYPATPSSPGLPAGEFAVALDEILASHRVHVYRQLMRPDGTTREFLIDVDGDGLPLVEGVEAAGPEPRARRSVAEGRAVSEPTPEPTARPRYRLARPGQGIGTGRGWNGPSLDHLRAGRGHEAGSRRSP